MAASRGPESLTIDGISPQSVVNPTTIDQLSAELSKAHSAREAVIPWGGGTRMHVGNAPERYTVALDLTGLSEQVVHEAGDLTLIADAGVTIGKLTEILDSPVVPATRAVQ